MSRCHLKVLLASALDNHMVPLAVGTERSFWQATLDGGIGRWHLTVFLVVALDGAIDRCYLAVFLVGGF